MSLIGSELKEVWNVLGQRRSQYDFYLERVEIKSFRGIEDLRVDFEYPVSVVAGPNGCGKTTLLLACACAYRQASGSSRDLLPSNVFPNFKDRLRETLSDQDRRSEFSYQYIDGGQPIRMAWRRGKRWNRSGEQPKRVVYVRTLANLTNPSEARGALGLMRKDYVAEPLTPVLLDLAERILPQRYRRVSVVSAAGTDERDLLFAEVEDHEDARYSEFHMSSGERTILRLSKDLSGLEDALVLIDEIDTGLHPYTQQQLMLELQRIALRQRLQVIVASHSPVVLESVPATPNGRLFLDRDEETLDVRLLPPHRDIFQKALYGQSREQLSILCEDEVAEGALLGVLDVLQPRLQLRPDDFLIGRNTGRDEYPAHIRALGKFRGLFNFVFVLDGDSRDREAPLRSLAESYGHSFQPLFLPGDGPPEQWIWQVLRERPGEYQTQLGMSEADIRAQMREAEQVMAGSLRMRESEAAKLRVGALARRLNRSASDLARIVGRRETEIGSYDIGDLVQGFEERIALWRRLQ